MKRVAVLALVALAGCGAPKPRDAKREIDKHAGEARKQVDKALRDVERSDLPEDAKQQLREAKKLLDDDN